MAYRARINMSDPRLQTAAVRARKGNAAVPNARLKGLYSSFAAGEGSRLASAAQAGRELASTAAQRKHAAVLAKAGLELDKKQLARKKKMFNDEKLGNKIALGLGIGQLGLGAWDSMKQRQHNAAQARFQQRLPIVREAVVPANRAAAGRFGHEAFRLGRY